MKKAAVYIAGTALALMMLAACGGSAGTITTPAPTETVDIMTPAPTQPAASDSLPESPAPSIAGDAGSTD